MSNGCSVVQSSSQQCSQVVPLTPPSSLGDAASAGALQQNQLPAYMTLPHSTGDNYATMSLDKKVPLTPSQSSPLIYDVYPSKIQSAEPTTAESHSLQFVPSSQEHNSQSQTVHQTVQSLQMPSTIQSTPVIVEPVPTTNPLPTLQTASQMIMDDLFLDQVNHSIPPLAFTPSRSCELLKASSG